VYIGSSDANVYALDSNRTRSSDANVFAAKGTASWLAEVFAGVAAAILLTVALCVALKRRKYTVPMTQQSTMTTESPMPQIARQLSECEPLPSWTISESEPQQARQLSECEPAQRRKLSDIELPPSRTTPECQPPPLASPSEDPFDHLTKNLEDPDDVESFVESCAALCSKHGVFTATADARAQLKAHLPRLFPSGVPHDARTLKEAFDLVKCAVWSRHPPKRGSRGDESDEEKRGDIPSVEDLAATASTRAIPSAPSYAELEEQLRGEAERDELASLASSQ